MRLNFIFFGPPGSGKGTQSAIICNKYNFKHISTGDIFRYNISNKTSLGNLAYDYIKTGNLVPDNITLDMIDKKMKALDRERGIILDGFPRNISQAISLDKMLNKTKDSISIFFEFYLNEDEVVKRLKGRANKEGRLDDLDDKAINKRLADYKSNRDDLRSYYSKANKYKKIEAWGSIENISSLIFYDIDKFIDYNNF